MGLFGGHDAVITRTVRIQLAIFLALTLVALVVLGWYYLRLPSAPGSASTTSTPNSRLPAACTRRRT